MDCMVLRHARLEKANALNTWEGGPLTEAIGACSINSIPITSALQNIQGIRYNAIEIQASVVKPCH